MTGKFKNGLIIGIIIVILMLPIVISYINSKKVNVKTIDEFKSLVPKSTMDLFYFGDLESDNYSNVKEMLLDIRSENNIDVYSVDSKENTEYLVSISSEFENGSAFVVAKEGEIFKVFNKDTSKEEISKKISNYINNIVPESDIAYKTVSTFKEYMTLVNSKKITMAVFGRNSCSWCNKFKPVYNEVAQEYNIDIYYFDSDSFNSNEYSKILNSGLTIPEKCTKTQKDELLSSGFGTPLTLFTSNGKSIGCIGGYVNKTVLISELKEIGLVN